MRTGWIVNLLLLAGVAGLAAYAIYRPAGQEAAQHKISALLSSEIKRIVIEPKAGKRLELERRGEDWFLVQPLQARADRTQVDRLLDLLSASSKDKLPAADLQRFDLDAPSMKVTFNDRSFAFGTTNPLSQDQYVLSGDSIYLLPGYYRSLVPQSPERVLTHALFRRDEKPVAFATKGFKVEQRDGNWQVIPSPAAANDKPSQDDFNRWADDWRLASSLLTQPAGATAGAESIEIRLADGRTVKLGVLQREPELVLARADEKLTFHFSGEVARRLLSPPAVSAAPEPASATSAVKPQ